MTTPRPSPSSFSFPSRFIILIACFIIAIASLSGDKISAEPTIPKTLKNRDASDIPPTPEARSFSQSWTTKNGNFYVFGGDSLSGIINDLWKYEPTSNRWTQIHSFDTVTGGSSVGDPVNGTRPPGRRNAATWTDHNGDLWLFGGFGGGLLNDLWKFTIENNRWEAIFQSDDWTDVPGIYDEGFFAYPGSRDKASAWLDHEGNLMLFGGSGYGANMWQTNSLNDLWKFNITKSEWEVVYCLGDSLANHSIISGNHPIPGSRFGAISWSGQDGNVWIFGGSGLGADPLNSIQTYLNDLWKYLPAENRWEFFGGTGDYLAEYNQLGENPFPASRSNSASWISSDSKLWMYGGFSIKPVTGDSVVLGDLWSFDTKTARWSYHSGNQKIYDNHGTFSGENVYPGAKVYAVYNTNDGANFYLFGGWGYGLNGGGAYNDDMFSYNSNSHKWTLHSTPADPKKEPVSLEINGKANLTEVKVGEFIEFTVSTTNKGEKDAYAVQLINNFSTNLEFKDASLSSSLDQTNSKLTIDYPMLKAGVNQDCKLRFKVLSDDQKSNVSLTGHCETENPIDFNNSQTNYSVYINLKQSLSRCDYSLTGHWNPVLSHKTKSSKKRPTVHSVKTKSPVIIENKGQTATPTTSVKLYLSDDAVLDSTDKEISTTFISSIKPGKSKKIKLKPLSITDSDPHGKTLIIDIVSPTENDTVLECDRSDNVLVSDKIPAAAN